MPSNRRAFLKSKEPPSYPDTVDWHQTDEYLLMAVPKHMDPDIAVEREEWLVGRGREIEP